MLRDRIFLNEEAIANFFLIKKIMNKLIENLKLVNDYRSPKGKRQELWVVLLVIILGIMAGYVGYRAIGDFAQYLIIQKIGRQNGITSKV